MLAADIPGDDLATAEVLSLAPNTPVELSESIGDGLHYYNDVDLFELDLQAGQTVDIDVDAYLLDDGSSLSSLESYLRIFDDVGTELTTGAAALSENDYDGSGYYGGYSYSYYYYDAYLNFTAPATGTYFIGVSAAGNTNYNPLSAGSGSSGTSGAYRLQLLTDGGPPAGTNQSPFAANDTFAVDVGATLTVAAPGVLANDSDPENDSITATLASGPSEGTLSYLSADGAFEYIADTTFTGTDTFTYVSSDGTGSSNLATVTISVSPPAVADTPGDDLANAQTINLVSGSEQTIEEEVGNGLHLGSDIDLFAIPLEAGQIFTADIDAYSLSIGGEYSQLDSYLRIFDSSGAELLSADDNQIGASSGYEYNGYYYNSYYDGTYDYYDAGLELVVPASATYYIGVSSIGNETYDSTTSGSGRSGYTTGAYRLKLLAEDPPLPELSLSDSEPTVSEAASAIGLTVSLSAPSVNTVTVSFATNDGTASAGSDYSSVSGTLSFAPGETSKGLSVPILEDTDEEAAENFVLTLSSSTHAALDIDQVSVEIGENDHPADVPGDDLSTAQTVGLVTGIEQTFSEQIGDGSYGVNDVDLYQVSLDAGQLLVADVDSFASEAGGTNTYLDSYLRVFDSNGLQVASNDDRVGSYGYYDDYGYGGYDYSGYFSEESLDPYLSFAVPTTGTYYLAISTADNTAFDPIVPGSGRNIGGGAYQLHLSVTVPELERTTTTVTLADDTGEDDSDLVTNNPTLRAVIEGLWQGAATLEFDIDGDGQADSGVAVYGPGQSIEYDPRQLDASLSSHDGPLAISYRTVLHDQEHELVATSAWTDFSFDLHPLSKAEIEVIDESLVNLVSGIDLVDIGSTEVGTPLAHTFTVNNAGTEPLTLDSASLSLPPGFSLVSGFVGAVPVGGSTDFTIELDAPIARRFEGPVSFVTNDADESLFRFTVSGEVIEPPRALDLIVVRTEAGMQVHEGTGTQYLGSTELGTPLQYTFTIANTGDSDVAFNPAVTLPAGITAVNPLAATVSAGGETEWTVQIDATAIGFIGGSIGISSSDNSDSLAFVVNAEIVSDIDAIRLEELRLLHDTGASSTDLVTSDPTFRATVRGDFQYGSVDVEFDHNGDATADGSVGLTFSGQLVTYDPRINDATLTNHVGPLTLSYRTIHYDSQGSILTTSGWSDFSFEMVAEGAVAGLHVDDMRLLRDTGVSNSDLVTTDPSIVGQLEGALGGGYAIIEFDQDADQAADASTTVYVEGESFVYDPRDTDDALNNYVGPVSIAYRILKFDAVGTLEGTGSWTSLDFSLQAASVSDLSVQGLALLNDSGPDSGDGVTVDGTVTGMVLDEHSLPVGLVGIEIDHNGDLQPDVSAATDEDGRFSYDTLSETGLGTHTVRVRAARWEAEYGATLYSSWVPLTFTIISGVSGNVVDFRLKHDTGISSSDLVTSDATVTGLLEDDHLPWLENIAVDIDIDGDGAVDGTAWTDQDGRFDYVPSGLSEGAVTVAARARVWDEAVGNYAIGNWNSLAFTYQETSRLLPEVTLLELANDTGSDASDDITEDVTVVGTVTKANKPAPGVTVEIDTDGDNVADDTVASDAYGHFSYVPSDVAIGQATIHARTIVWDGDSGAFLGGSWLAFTFTREASFQTEITVSSFTLANDTGDDSTDGITTDPMVRGRLAQVGRSTAYQQVQIDAGADGTIDASVISSADGKFEYLPTNLSLGQHSFAVRGRTWDYASGSHVFGPWKTLNFVLEEDINEVPTISALKLQADTGVSQTDGITANLMLAGSVSDDDSLRGITLEFDHDGDGDPEGFAFTGEQGLFDYQAYAINYGPVTIQARPVQWDAANGQYLYGSWVPLSFTYENQANSAPAFASLGLASDTGENATDGVTSDSRVVGRILNERELGGLTILVDVDADGAADMTTTTDRLGRFSFEPSELTPGPVTLHVRSEEFDPTSGDHFTSAWTPLTFTYEAPPTSALSIGSWNLVSDTGDSAIDKVSSDGEVSGTVVDDAGSEPAAFQQIQIDEDGDGAYDAIVYTDASGKFRYDPDDLDAGAVELKARVVEYDEVGAPSYGDWSAFTFTLEDAPDGLNHLVDVELANDTGASSSDGATNDATLQGRVVRDGVPQSEIEVYIDFDSDGVEDATVQTDASGTFFYSPADELLDEGVIHSSLRLESSDATGASSGSGEIVQMRHVYSETPDAPETQSLVSALETFDTDWQNAVTTATAAAESAESQFIADRTSANSTYDTAIANASQTRFASLSAARSAYRSALQTSDSVFATAKSSAFDSYSGALAGFTGDTTSYAEAAYKLGPAPAENRFEMPSELPQSPVQRPVYSGIKFDFEQDPEYQQDVQTAESAHRNTMQSEQSLLDGKRKTAKDAFESAVTAAQTTFDTDWSAAQQANTAARTALAHPTIDLDEERQALEKSVKEIVTKYDAIMDRVAREKYDFYNDEVFLRTEQEAMSNAQVNELLAALAQYGVSHTTLLPIEVQAHLQYDYMSDGVAIDNQWWVLDANTQKDWAYELAEATRQAVEDRSAQEAAFKKKVAEHDHWLDTEREKLRHSLEEDRADLQETKEKKIADAVKDQELSRADAKAAYDDAVSNADKLLDIAKATAIRESIERWDTAEDTAWSDYQLDRAQNALKYVSDAAENRLTKELAEHEAKRIQRRTLAASVHTNDYARFAADNDRIIARSESLRDFETAALSADESRISSDADALRQRKVAHVVAGETRKKSYADALVVFEEIVAPAHTAAEQSMHEQEKVCAIQQDTMDFDASLCTWDDTAHETFGELQHTEGTARRIKEIDADETRNNEQDLALKNLYVNANASEKAWVDGIADAHTSYESDLADADRDQYIALVAAGGTYNENAATAAAVYTSSVSFAVETLQKNEAVYSQTWSNDDATDLQDFQVGVATSYYEDVLAWDATEDTAISQYYLDLAKAEKDRVTTLAQANVDYVDAIGIASVQWTNLVASEIRWHNATVADADKIETTAMRAHNDAFAADVGDAMVDLATGIANETAGHDKEVAAVNQSYQDQRAGLQYTRHTAWDAAYFKSQRTWWEGFFNRHHFHITEAQLQVIGNDAYALQLFEQSTSEQGWANGMAAARDTRTQNHGSAEVAFATDLASEQDTWATAMKTAIVDVATDRATEADARTLLVAGSAEGFFDAVTDANIGFDSSQFSANAAFEATDGDSASTQREAVDEALGTLQIALATEHSDDLQSAVLVDSEDWSEYQAAVAAADATLASNVASARNEIHIDITTARAGLADKLELADSGYVSELGVSTSTYAGKLTTADKNSAIATAAAFGKWNISLHTASATRVESSVAAIGTYGIDKADQERILGNARSAANVTWVATMAPVLAQQWLGEIDQAAYEQAEAGANQTRDTAFHAASVTYAEDLGDDQIQLATDLGEALVVYAGAEGAAGVQLTTDLKTANDQLASDRELAENTRTSSNATANKSFRDSMAVALKGLTEDVGTAQEGLQNKMGTANTTRATAVASDLIDYQKKRAVSRSTETDSWATAEGTIEATVEALRAAANSTYVTQLVSAFSSLTNGTASAEASYGSNIVTAIAGGRDLQAAGEVTYVSQTGTLQSSFLTGGMSDGLGFETGNVSRLGTRDVALSEGDKGQLVDYAKATKEYAIDAAKAERAYQIAVLASLSTAEKDKDTAIADAILKRETAEADADLAWTTRKAAANRLLAEQQATAAKGLEGGLAGKLKTLINGVASEKSGLATDTAAAQTDTWLNLATAENTQDSNQKVANSGFRTSDLSAKNAGETVIDTGLSSDWSGFLVDAATAGSDWWTGFQQTFSDWVSDTNGERTAMQTGINTAYTLAVNTLGTISTGVVNTMASAGKTKVESIAEANRVYAWTVAEGTETYVVAVAQADRDFRVARAQAARDLKVNEDLSQYDQDMATAKSEKKTSLATASKNYTTAEAGAESQRIQAVTQAEKLYADTTEDAQAGATGDSQDAINAFTKARAGKVDEYATNVAAIDKLFHQNYGQSFADELTTLFNSTGTPWAERDAGLASATATKMADAAVAGETLIAATADADHTFTDTKADALGTLVESIADAAATANKAIAAALAAAGTTLGNLLTGLAAAFGYKPKMPHVPDAPELEMPQISGVGKYFDGFAEKGNTGLSGMFYLRDVLAESGPRRLQEDLLLDRQIDPEILVKRGEDNVSEATRYDYGESAELDLAALEEILAELTEKDFDHFEFENDKLESLQQTIESKKQDGSTSQNATSTTTLRSATYNSTQSADPDAQNTSTGGSQVVGQIPETAFNALKAQRERQAAITETSKTPPVDDTIPRRYTAEEMGGSEPRDSSENSANEQSGAVVIDGQTQSISIFSQGLIGVDAGDATNPGRDVQNSPLSGSDPNGLESPYSRGKQIQWAVRSCIVCHNPIIMNGGSLADLPEHFQIGALEALGVTNLEDGEQVLGTMRTAGSTSRSVVITGGAILTAPVSVPLVGGVYGAGATLEYGVTKDVGQAADTLPFVGLRHSPEQIETIADSEATPLERALAALSLGANVLDAVPVGRAVGSLRVMAPNSAATGGRAWTHGFGRIGDDAAEGAYAAIRESTTDVAAISRYTGYKPARLQRIKEYLFKNPEWSGADGEIAGAWHRLRTGRGTDVDKLLLKHETAEMWLRARKNLDYLDAHRAANQRWNWQDALPWGN